MRTRIVALSFFLAASALLSLADTLPAYCGTVGATSYPAPAVNIPPVILTRGTVITVTNATVAINGDVSSVAKLMANPGPDGISIQEAMLATNNEPGIWNIQFAAALKGSTIVVDPGLPFLTAGNVTINGDIDGDGQPDITLTSMSGNLTVYVISGGNTLNGLALQNCGVGGCVTLRTPSASGGLVPGPVATGMTFSNTTISNLVMTNISMQGAGIQICPNCGTNATSPTGNTWDHVLITGNAITGNASGPNIAIGVHVAWGDTVRHTTIANNNLVLSVQQAIGISLGTGGGLGPPDQGSDIVLDTRVINNTITAPNGMIFRGGTAVGSLYDGAQVIGNQINTTGGTGITFFPADVENGLVGTLVQPYNNNVIRNVAILANTIQGPGVGIQVIPGQNAAANNSISNVSILGNTILIPPQSASGGPQTGIFLFAGRSDDSEFVATGNSLSNILIQANNIQSSVPAGNFGFGGGMFEYAIESAGISVFGGIGAQGNSIKGISIANNEVNTPSVGIAITGGYGDTTPAGITTFSADGNVVVGVQIFCNQVDQIPTLGVLPSSGVEGINVVAGLDEATGNQVQQAYIADNLVAGVLGGASVFASLSGASGNTLTTSASPAPAISLAANVEGESPVIAPNTWIEIKGVNLAADTRSWVLTDFVNNQLPIALDGTSVTINGENAFVFYVSPTQINVLTPPDLATGLAQVQVTSSTVSSAPLTVQVQQVSPSFFVINGSPYVLAIHPDGGLVGSWNLFPGATSPAVPGETLIAYANGLGPTSEPVVAGSSMQSGALTPLPLIQVGGKTANVRFAGLLSPGIYQLTFDVPLDLPAGDCALSISVGGGATQAGILITVQP